jgi:CRP-like cAMP-binding protein
MLITEAEIFRGLGASFMKELSEAARVRNLPADRLIFEMGQPAENLYLLARGGVNLFIRQEGSVNFNLDTPGAVFGWSALVQPNIYTASARTYRASQVLSIEHFSLERIMERHPREAYLVMKRLAGVVGQRLVNSYQEILRSRSGVEDATPSYG